jgi:hypothetical protein
MNEVYSAILFPRLRWPNCITYNDEQDSRIVLLFYFLSMYKLLQPAFYRGPVPLRKIRIIMLAIKLPPGHFPAILLTQSPQFRHLSGWNQCVPPTRKHEYRCLGWDVRQRFGRIPSFCQKDWEEETRHLGHDVRD